MPDSINVIAREIADYVIDHDLARQPRNAEDMQSLIIRILEDRHVKADHTLVTDLTTNMISNDPRVFVESKGKEEDWAIWVYRKR